MRLVTCLRSLLSLLCVVILAQTRVASRADTSAVPKGAVTKRPWPHPIPLRVREGGNRELMVMTLGEVETPLAEGTYDPATDEATLKDGTVTKNYYRDKLGVKYFTPIDKTNFPLPPSGWCTWYYYYQQINENEVRQNARWIADNLKDYGAQYVQIDEDRKSTRLNSSHTVISYAVFCLKKK